MIKNSAVILIFLSIIGFIAVDSLLSREASLSLIISSTLLLINMVGLAILWKEILNKKSIARIAVAIIFKYLILGLILWKITSLVWLNGVGFILGFVVFLISILIAFIFRRSRAF